MRPQFLPALRRGQRIPVIWTFFHDTTSIRTYDNYSIAFVIGAISWLLRAHKNLHTSFAPTYFKKLRSRLFCTFFYFWADPVDLTRGGGALLGSEEVWLVLKYRPGCSPRNVKNINIPPSNITHEVNGGGGGRSYAICTISHYIAFSLL